MPTPQVILRPESAAYLKQGFDQLAELLAITLGPTQGMVLNYSTTKQRPEMLNDSATIARRFVALPDRRQDVGAMLLRQLVWRMHERVGDGGATMAVLAQAILEEASRMVAAGANTVALQTGVKRAADIALAALAEMARPAADEEDLVAVAHAVTADSDLAWVLAEMFDLLGANAHITIEEYVAPYLERIYLDGGRWAGQLASPYLMTAPATGRVIQKNCWVALCDQRLTETEAIKSLLGVIAQQKPPHLLLVAPAIGGEALNWLVAAHQHAKNPLKIVAVSQKVGGDQGRQELDDLALLTGATLLGEAVGRPLHRISAQDLGRAVRVEANKEALFVVRGGGDGRAIREAIAALQARLADGQGEEEVRADLRRRLARLSGSAGVLKIGAHSKVEREVLHQKAEQAIKVLAATLSQGVLPGGGAAYLQAASCIQPELAHGDERLGMLTVKRALPAPFIRVLRNAHLPAAAVALNDVLQAGNGAVYDVLREQIRPAREAGVLDSAAMVQAALETAASGAMMALSVDVTVLRRRPVTNVDYRP